ncbi:MAG: hypothetical protein MRERV_38c008 [Mycoplasmataceae bacterium RV_VA103A]|nr:MAG: hypothetical protein MRERV_38c008 [Mycoplasmataceae bacterium RV_VA103A]
MELSASGYFTSGFTEREEVKEINPFLFLVKEALFSDFKVVGVKVMLLGKFIDKVLKVRLGAF